MPHPLPWIVKMRGDFPLKYSHSLTGENRVKRTESAPSPKSAILKRWSVPVSGRNFSIHHIKLLLRFLRTSAEVSSNFCWGFSELLLKFFQISSAFSSVLLLRNEKISTEKPYAPRWLMYIKVPIADIFREQTHLYRKHKWNNYFFSGSAYKGVKCATCCKSASPISNKTFLFPCLNIRLQQ